MLSNRELNWWSKWRELFTFVFQCNFFFLFDVSSGCMCVCDNFQIYQWEQIVNDFFSSTLSLSKNSMKLFIQEQCEQRAGQFNCVCVCASVLKLFQLINLWSQFGHSNRPFFCMLSNQFRSRISCLLARSLQLNRIEIFHRKSKGAKRKMQMETHVMVNL